MEPYILGIDIGTGSTKSIAVDFGGNSFSVVQFHYSSNSPAPGLSEQDPELIWKAFVDCVVNHVTKLSYPPKAICLSSAMHSVVPVDDNGNALAGMITWADGRSADIATRVKESPSGENIYRKTGTPLHAMSPLCKIIWLRENNKELFDKTNKFISIKEYIWFKLFNEFKVDISIASATGLLNIESNQWDIEALQVAGITDGHLSEPVEPGYTRYILDQHTIDLLRLPPEVSFMIGASDGCLANLGSFALKENEAAVTIGTSGAVRLCSKQPIYDFEAMTFNYRLDNELYVSGGPINNGGNVLLWFFKNILAKETLTDKDYELLFEDIEKIKAGAHGIIFLPYLNGERAPYWDTKSCGTFFGIKAHHSTIHFARAVVEGICFALNTVLEKLENNDNKITQLNVSGGFVTSKTWMQILADVTGKRICIINTDDASAIGAAYFAIKRMGIAKDYSKLFAEKDIAFIEPKSNNHSVYNNYFSIFKSLYQNLKDQMHILHNLNHQ